MKTWDEKKQGWGRQVMLQKDSTSLLRQRRDSIREWLDDEAPYTDVDQRHLDAHTPERAYWHHGYQAALNDVMTMLALEGGRTGNADIPN
jgi:hypothetical protein